MTDTQHLDVDTEDLAGAPPDEEPEDVGQDDVAPEETTRRSGRDRLGSWPWLVLIVGIVAASVAFYSWQQAGADTEPERVRADLRDQAIIEGTAAVETMNTMDHRDVPAGLEAWESVTTGTLHDQLAAISEEEQKLLAEQGKIATGRVVQAALTELTDGTATMIAAVEVTVADDGAGDGAGDGTGDSAGTDTGDGEAGGEPSVKRNRFSAHLVLVDGHWKLEELGQVPVNLQ